jgi:cation diffusion facilitator CzcD-associated flavoprotein CzcO
LSGLIDVLVVGAGQAGLAAARALQEFGLEPVVLEAGERPTGSWPRYYESLTPGASTSTPYCSRPATGPTSASCGRWAP